jgi:hypothetical protein
VDLWAPGDQITSDWVPGNPLLDCTDTCTISGTSMAAPHVTGAIALLLTRPGWAVKLPSLIKDQLENSMTSKDKLTGLGAGSPNKLLYVVPPPTAGASSIAVARNGDDGRLSLFGVTPTGQLYQRNQSGPGSAAWTTWSPSVYQGWYSTAAQTDGDGRINSLGLRHAPQDVWLRAQAAAGSSGWYVTHQFGGLLSSAALATNKDGRLELFGTNSQGQVWHSSQLVVAGITSYTPWAAFDVPDTIVRAVAAETNAGGLVEVFALTNAGAIWHRWETSPGSGTYTPWVALDGQLSSIAVARHANGRLVLFGVNGAGQVFRREAGAGTNNWLAWVQLDVPTVVGQLRSLAAETNVDGRVEVFAVNMFGQLWHRAQVTAEADAYQPWVQLPGLALRP